MALSTPPSARTWRTLGSVLRINPRLTRRFNPAREFLGRGVLVLGDAGA